MSKWIDAEWLKELYKPYESYNGKELAVPIGAILANIDDAPSIDIVRCKECKHREKYPCDEIEFYECSHLRLYGTKVGVEDDWFCADGERKESE